jgi:NAD(P)-dependent dehydrogenase (short-subunit alcohol dehydrogenase family)
MSTLDGKVAVITGAGRGIGREEALLFAREGARVVVNDLGVASDGVGPDARVAAQLVEEIRGRGGDAVPHSEDVSEPQGAGSLVQLALDTWGRLDVVVNNAGVLRDRMIYNMSVDEWDAVIKVHLRGHFLVTREACRHWRALASTNGPAAARIINTTSTSGLLGSVGQANYGAAKAGIAAFTQIVAMEMYRHGVTVNAIAPGARTRLTEKAYGRATGASAGFDPLAPEHVAVLVAYLASDAASHITGQVFRIRGGLVQLYQAWTPVAAQRKDGPWTVSEMARVVGELFADHPAIYAPPSVIEEGLSKP